MRAGKGALKYGEGNRVAADRALHVAVRVAGVEEDVIAVIVRRGDHLVGAVVGQGVGAAGTLGGEGVFGFGGGAVGVGRNDAVVVNGFGLQALEVSADRDIGRAGADADRHGAFRHVGEVGGVVEAVAGAAG